MPTYSIRVLLTGEGESPPAFQTVIVEPGEGESPPLVPFVLDAPNADRAIAEAIARWGKGFEGESYWFAFTTETSPQDAVASCKRFVRPNYDGQSMATELVGEEIPRPGRSINGGKKEMSETKPFEETLIITIDGGIVDHVGWGENEVDALLRIDYDCLEGGQCPACSGNIDIDHDDTCVDCGIAWKRDPSLREIFDAQEALDRMRSPVYGYAVTVQSSNTATIKVNAANEEEAEEIAHQIYDPNQGKYRQDTLFIARIAREEYEND